jgi:hypothetical protein
VGSNGVRGEDGVSSRVGMVAKGAKLYFSNPYLQVMPFYQIQIHKDPTNGKPDLGRMNSDLTLDVFPQVY